MLSTPMLPAPLLFDALQKPYLLTIIQQIAVHLLAACNGDLDQARKSAWDVIRAYNAETELELRLAARVIGFNLQANEALAQAADPAVPVMHQIRLRSGAVSLSREADKAERQLQKLQEARRQGVPEAPQAQLEPVPASVEKAAALVDETTTISAYAKAHGLSWTDARNQRQRERSLEARKAKDARRAAAAIASAVGQVAART